MVLLKLKSSNQKQPDYTEDNIVIFIIQQRWDRKNLGNSTKLRQLGARISKGDQ
jgi:hypothetical protein